MQWPTDIHLKYHQPTTEDVEGGSPLTKKVLVTGVGGPAGRATATFLRQRGINVIGTDIRHVEEVCDTFHRVPRGDDPSFTDAILSLVSRERPVLLIPTVSEELPTVSRLRHRLRALGVQVFISEPAVVDLANDKFDTVTQLKELRIPVPETLILSGRHGVTEAGESLGYPFLVKPRVGRGGRGVVVYQQASDAVLEQRTDVVCQEFMPGEECDLNLFAYPAGHVKTIAVLQKTRMKQGIVGNALSVQRVIRRDMAELGIRVTRTLKLEGPNSMKARRDRNGVPRILAIDPLVGSSMMMTEEILESLLVTTFEAD
jgi:carbamoyl-phosphate synthase large subunit